MLQPAEGPLLLLLGLLLQAAVHSHHSFLIRCKPQEVLQQAMPIVHSNTCNGLVSRPIFVLCQHIGLAVGNCWHAHGSMLKVHTLPWSSWHWGARQLLEAVNWCSKLRQAQDSDGKQLTGMVCNRNASVGHDPDRTAFLISKQVTWTATAKECLNIITAQQASLKSMKQWRRFRRYGAPTGFHLCPECAQQAHPAAPPSAQVMPSKPAWWHYNKHDPVGPGATRQHSTPREPGRVDIQSKSKAGTTSQHSLTCSLPLQQSLMPSCPV